MSALIAAAALAYAGLAALSLTNPRHRADIYGLHAGAPASTALLAAPGWCALALSFSVCVAGRGWHMGPLLWLGLLTVCALCQTMLLWRAPRLAPRLSRAMAIIGSGLCLHALALGGWR